MKDLKIEKLSRKEMKNVLGGLVAPGGGGSEGVWCKTDKDCNPGLICKSAMDDARPHCYVDPTWVDPS